MGIITNRRPLFSAIINNYNYGRYVEEAIESVLNQTFSKHDMEIIVVDDGSTDDTAERLKKYSGTVRYITKKNGGQASALNMGIENANGRIIAFLDADDYWHPSKLDTVNREFDRSDMVDFVYHFMNVVDDTGRIIDRYIYPDPLSAANSGESFLDMYLRGNLPWFSSTSGMAVRADCLKKACPIPEDFCIGADLFLHYVLPFYMRELSLIRKPLGYYRLHGGNLSGGNLLTADKIQRETGMMLLIQKHVGDHSRKLGYDSGSVTKRLESFVAWYRILFDILTGEKIRALRRIVSFDEFLPDDDFFHRFFRKMVMLVYVVLPPSLCLWLQREYRKMSYAFHRDRPGG